MKHPGNLLTLATALLLMPMVGVAQSSNTSTSPNSTQSTTDRENMNGSQGADGSPNSNGYQHNSGSQTSTGTQAAMNSQNANGSQENGSHVSGKREAAKMVPARAELMQALDAKKTLPGAGFQAKLSKTAHLHDGTELPAGTLLMGKVVQDDMQQQGMSKLALRFTSAQLKNGKTIPIKATIVGIFKPGYESDETYPVNAGDQVPNSWNDGTLQIDQLGVISGVDLHSKISSRNSGVLVSTKKDNVTLKEGSEIQLAIARQNGQGGNGNEAENQHQ